MKNLNELKKELDIMISIYRMAVIYYKDNIYLMNPDTVEERVVAFNDYFIKRARYSAGIISVIQICKLFGGKNEAYSITKFLNKLQNLHKNSELNSKISSESINQWQIKLSDQKIVHSINKIKTLRDQYFAHSDRNPYPFEDLILHEKEVKELFDFCENILLKINSEVFNEYFWWHNHEIEKASGILSSLSRNVIKY